MLLRNAFLKLSAITAVVLLSLPGLAQGLCKDAHRTGYVKFAERGRVEKRVKANPEISQIKGANDEVMLAFPGGSLFIKEKPLNPKIQKAVMELIRLWTYTREKEMPVKKLENKEVLTLALPLGNGYSIELVYHANTRNENLSETGPQIPIESRFTLVEVHGAGPNSIYLKGAGRIRSLDGKLTERSILDLTDLPGISEADFIAHVPDTISGKTLETFLELAPQLKLFEKQELWDLARKDSYYQLKFKAFTREFTDMIRRYHWKGIGKSWVKFITVPVLAITAFVGVKKVAPEFVETSYVTMQKAVSIDYNAWVQESLIRLSTSPAMSPGVRQQIELLKLDFKKAVENESIFTPLTQKHPFDLVNRNRLQVGKEEYIWVQKTLDPATNKEITLFYVAKLSARTGRVHVAVTPVDPAKYQTLIQYLENQGEFTIPLTGSTGQ